MSQPHDDEMILQASSGAKLTLRKLTPGLVSAIKQLLLTPSTEDQLSEIVLQSDGLSGVSHFYFHLQQFKQLGMICYSVAENETLIATLSPFSSYFHFQDAEFDSQKQYKLSRFALCRKGPNGLLVESPIAHAQVVLHDWRGAALVQQLAVPVARDVRAQNIAGLSPETIESLVALLAGTGFLSELNEDGKTAEEENLDLSHWEFHDLFFHSRSRVGRHSNPLGANLRFLGKVEPLPAIKAEPPREKISLYKPNIELLKESDIPFTRILEERRTLKLFDEDRPITADQLGEFLYRTARIKSVLAPDPSIGIPYERTVRPYPGGGACYELELYLTIRNCDGIAPGFYHYDPLPHQLCRISELNEHTEGLLQGAVMATRASKPQVLITMAARFRRMTWKYDSISYAVILKDVGVLQQTMYLVATALNLAPCAIGGGNSDTLAQAAGTDYLAESSVGEFMLGSKAAY